MPNEKPWTEMKLLLRRCGLTYEEAGWLVGASHPTVRSWLRPAVDDAGKKKAGAYEIPPTKLAYFRWLADNGFSMAQTAEASTPIDLMRRFWSGSTESIEPEALKDISARLDLAREFLDVTETISIARRLLAMASAETVVRILMQAKGDNPIAYGFRNGGAIVALLSPETPNPPYFQIEFIREVRLRGRSLVDAAPLVFRFAPPIRERVVDATADFDGCLTIEGLAPGRDALPYLEDAYAVLVAHVLRQEGISLERSKESEP